MYGFYDIQEAKIYTLEYTVHWKYGWYMKMADFVSDRTLKWLRNNGLISIHDFWKFGCNNILRQMWLIRSKGIRRLIWNLYKQILQ